MGLSGNMGRVFDKASGTNQGSAKPGDVFVGYPTITAQDSTNAAKLGPLGFVAVPTSNWTTGQKITVSGTSPFLFNWNGTAWAAGAHA